jgi:hypothetical protein
MDAGAEARAKLEATSLISHSWMSHPFIHFKTKLPMSNFSYPFYSTLRRSGTPLNHATRIVPSF